MMARDSDGDGSPPHVALMAFPFASHPGNLFTFASLLASALPDAFFSFFTSPPSLAVLSKHPRPGNVRLHSVDDGCSKVAGPVVNVLERIGLFINAMPGNFVAGMEEAVTERGGAKVSCVVSDAFLCAAGEVAEEMGVPWVPLWTCAPAALLAHLCTDELRRMMGVQDQVDPAKAEEQLHCIPTLSTLRVRDLPMGILFDVSSDLSTLLHRAANRLPAATAVAVNTFQGLNPDMDAELDCRLKKFLPVGPFNLISPPLQEAGSERSEQCLSWLDRQGPATVAYVSFGTVMMPPKTELGEVARGLEESGEPFLWSLKETSMESLPDGFLDRTKARGLVVPWASQAQVLGHDAVGAFVTHCGWNSVIEGITSGVPMICRPFMGDQPSSARMISQVWKLGVAFKGGSVTREEMARVLNVVLRGDEGKKMRARAGELKGRAVRAVAHGGTSEENFKCLLKMVCSK